MRDDGQGWSWGPLTVFEGLGGGSSPEVFRARWRGGNRIVALRLLTGGPRADVIASRALVERGRAWAALDHPHLVTVLGTAIHDDRAGLWMEFVEGTTLADQLAASGPLELDELITVGRAICDALAALHDAGLVHGDLRPRNVVRARGERLLLLDPSARFEPESGAAASTALGPGAPALFAAPELLRGEFPSVASDLYAAGALLYHLATADYPVRGETLVELRAAHECRPAPALGRLRREIPSAFRGAVERALASRPEDRFASADELRRALSEAADLPRSASREPPGHPPMKAPSWTWLVVLVAIAAGALGIAPLIRSPRPHEPESVPGAIDSDGVPPARAPRLAAQLFRSELPTDEALGTLTLALPGEQFYLMLEPAEEQILYVLLRRSDGTVISLLPDGIGVPGRRVDARRRIRVPEVGAGPLVNWTAGAPGRQTFLVLGAREPIPLLEAALLARSEEKLLLPDPLVAPLFIDDADLNPGIARGMFVVEVRAR